MKIKIITDRKPWAGGSPAMQGDQVEVTAEEGAALVKAGFAEEVKIKRARTATGKLQADDPTTPDVNEAWEGGKAPKKKKAKK